MLLVDESRGLEGLPLSLLELLLERVDLLLVIRESLLLDRLELFKELRLQSLGDSVLCLLDLKTLLLFKSTQLVRVLVLELLDLGPHVGLELHLGSINLLGEGIPQLDRLGFPLTAQLLFNLLPQLLLYVFAPLFDLFCRLLL